MIMTEIAEKKFEILEFTISDDFNANGLAEKLNELTDLVKNLNIDNVSKRFEIEFETHLLADVEIKNNVPIIKRAVNGWGDIVKTEDCKIKQL